MQNAKDAKNAKHAKVIGKSNLIFTTYHHLAILACLANLAAPTWGGSESFSLDDPEIEPLDPFLHLRQELAEHYLLHSDLPIQDIAQYLGFTEPRSFHRTFKSRTGVPPGEYRQTHRGS